MSLGFSLFIVVSPKISAVSQKYHAREKSRLHSSFSLPYRSHPRPSKDQREDRKMCYLITVLLLMTWTSAPLQAQDAAGPGAPDNEAVSAVPGEPSLDDKVDDKVDDKADDAKAPLPPEPSEAPKTEVPKSVVPEKKPSKAQATTPAKPSTKSLGKLADLKLSSEQTAAMIEARKSWNSEVEKNLREEVKAAKEELANAMIDNSSSEEVRKKFIILQRKYSDLQTLKFEKSLRIREILNLEQRKKFQEIRSKQAD